MQDDCKRQQVLALTGRKVRIDQSGAVRCGMNAESNQPQNQSRRVDSIGTAFEDLLCEGWTEHSQEGE